MSFTGERREAEKRERMRSGGPTSSSNKKNSNSQTKKTKLNFDYTIKFVLINSSKLDPTWIYLDKVISGSHSG
jgi:hypothetical protein